MYKLFIILYLLCLVFFSKLLFPRTNVPTTNVPTHPLYGTAYIHCYNVDSVGIKEQCQWAFHIGGNSLYLTQEEKVRRGLEKGEDVYIPNSELASRELGAPVAVSYNKGEWFSLCLLKHLSESKYVRITCGLNREIEVDKQDVFFLSPASL